MRQRKICARCGRDVCLDRHFCPHRHVDWCRAYYVVGYIDRETNRWKLLKEANKCPDCPANGVNRGDITKRG
jgi:hypothetical protein